MLVVELKDDGDLSDENRAKYLAATEHFGSVNGLQQEAQYYVKFVSPESYDAFFQSVADGTATSFVSGLQAALAT